MVACNVAHTLFNVPTKIARIRQQDYLESRWQDLFRSQHVPIDVIISPEVEVARAIALRLEVPGAINCVPFADDRVRLVGGARRGRTARSTTRHCASSPTCSPTCIWSWSPSAAATACSSPTPTTRSCAGDEVHFVVETAQRRPCAVGLRLRGAAERPADHRRRRQCRAVPRPRARAAPSGDRREADRDDPARAELVADRLQRTVVLQRRHPRAASCSRRPTSASASAMVTVTNNDEINIMAGLLAKRLGCRRSLALVNNSTYNLINRLDRRRRRGQPARHHRLEHPPACPPRPDQGGARDRRRRGRGLRGRGARRRRSWSASPLREARFAGRRDRRCASCARAR